LHRVSKTPVARGVAEQSPPVAGFYTLAAPNSGRPRSAIADRPDFIHGRRDANDILAGQNCVG
jgi:hypothetical protein